MTMFRYEADWLLQCLLLKIKSPNAYRYLRDNEYLPLPHPSTLQKLIRGMPCEFGFTSFVFDVIAKEYQHKKQRDKQGVIVFDEMKIRESLDYDKFSFQFNGFIHFGEFTADHAAKSGLKTQLADHALVFLYRSLTSKMVSNYYKNLKQI